MHPAAFVFDGLTRINRLHTVVFSGANRAITANQTITRRLPRGAILSLDTVSFAPLYGVAPLIGWTLTNRGIDAEPEVDYTTNDSITINRDITLYPIYEATEVSATGGTKHSADVWTDAGFTAYNNGGTGFVNNTWGDTRTQLGSGSVIHALNRDNIGPWYLVVNPAGDISQYCEATALARFYYGRTNAGTDVTRTFRLYKEGETTQFANVVVPATVPSTATSKQTSDPINIDGLNNGENVRLEVKTYGALYTHSLFSVKSWVIR